MTPIPFAYAGSISWGTMQPRDFVPAFLAVLEELRPRAAERITSDYADTLARMDDTAYADRVGCLVEDLWATMEDAAPAGYHFGAHEGDGSDYGYWLNEEEDE